MSLDSRPGSGGGHRWALYGGAGFIGQHLALSVLTRFPQDQVYLLDIQNPARISWKVPLQSYLGTGRLQVQACDVREYDSLRRHPAGIDIIVNLAAIHREPGHRSEEYFGTNVPGARNVCRLAEEVGCREIVFVSSISVYGEHNHPVDEDSIVHPRTPYGKSKHEAEVIHRDWAIRSGGRLSIIRPGVVFGHGEEGNVSRLLREMMSRNRAIRIRPDCAKAGIYIRELIEVIHWLRTQPQPLRGHHLVNGVSGDGLTFNAYGRALQGLRSLSPAPLTIPGRLVGVTASILKPLAICFAADSRFHPGRLGKLVLANDVRPAMLNKMGYPFAWPLERALADWLAQGL